MKIAILGAGNMGGATARGLLHSGLVEPFELTVTAAHAYTLQPYAEMGMRTTTDNRQAVADADLVVWAVKPWIAPQVAAEVRESLDLKRQLMVTLMPGIEADDFAAMVGGTPELRPQILYVIPNTAIEVGESMTFVSPVGCSQEQTDLVLRLFAPLGKVMQVEYRQMAACTALASCGIAFALRYVRASSEGGVQLGVKAHVAQDIVAQTLRGAAALLQQKGGHAEAEIDRVTTPGGMTIKGLNAMEANGFTHAVIEGLLAVNK